MTQNALIDDPGVMAYLTSSASVASITEYVAAATCLLGASVDGGWRWLVAEHVVGLNRGGWFCYVVFGSMYAAQEGGKISVGFFSFLLQGIFFRMLRGQWRRNRYITPVKALSLLCAWCCL